MTNNEAILAYVRFEKEYEFVGQMLFARKLITDITGKSIFEEM